MVTKFYAKQQALKECTKGATAIEYGLIAAGIAVAISAAVFLFGDDLTALFTTLSGKIT